MPLSKTPCRLAAFAIGAVVAMTVTACGSDSGSGSSDSEDPIRVGVLATETGAASSYGIPQLNGIKLAVEEINADGGVNVDGTKRKIELVVRDDASDPTKGVQAVQSLIQDTPFILGSMSSAVAGAYVPIVKDRDDVVVLSTGATLPGITDFKPIFRYMPAATGLENGVVNWVADEGITKVATLTDTAHSGFVSHEDQLKDDLSARDVDVVAAAKLKTGDTQFGAQIQSLTKADPDVIYFRGFEREGIAAISQARALGYDGPFVSATEFSTKAVSDQGTADDMDNVTEIVQPTLPAIVSSPDTFGAELSERAKTMVAAYEKEYGEDPGLLTGLGYDSVYVLAEAMSEAASASDVAKILSSLESLKLSTLTGLVTPVAGTPDDSLLPEHQAQIVLAETAWADGTKTVKGTQDPVLK